MEYFLLFFWKRLPTGERKKMNWGNKERPTVYVCERLRGICNRVFMQVINGKNVTIGFLFIEFTFIII